MSEKRERESEIISVSKELEALQREHQTVEPTETGEIQSLFSLIDLLLLLSDGNFYSALLRH